MVENFEQLNKIQLITRAYQLILERYKMRFNDNLVTIWSAPNYCYRCGNMARILKLDENLKQTIIPFYAASVDDRRIPAKILYQIIFCEFYNYFNFNFYFIIYYFLIYCYNIK